MRIRTIKPEFWASESMGRLDRDTRLVFIGLWSLADDQGRFRADPRYVAGQLFPYDDDGVQVTSRALASLRECSSVVLYEANGSKYGAICHWSEHQRIDRPSQSRIPQPPETSLANVREDSAKPREASCEEGNGREQGKEGKGEEQRELLAASLASRPTKRPKADTSQADPRHAPLVDALCREFAEVTGQRMPFGGRDAIGVKALLSTGADPAVIVDAWRKALRHRGYPTVRTPGELHQHLAHFVGAGPPARAPDARAPAAVPDWSTATAGEIPA